MWVRRSERIPGDLIACTYGSLDDQCGSFVAGSARAGCRAPRSAQGKRGIRLRAEPAAHLA
jgi:hypothetical protein